MHLYFITKGIKNEVDQFITELQGKYLPFKFREKLEDPLLDSQLQLSVRPIQLWEVGYPKEHHDIVCTTILGKDYQGCPDGNNGKKSGHHTWLKKWIKLLQKILHIKPLEKFKDDFAMPVRRTHITTIALGVKEDYTLPSGIEGL